MRRDLGPKAKAVYESVRRGIVSGEYAADTMLPSRPALARAMGVATMTVTQAYNRLEVDGLVTSRQGVGTIVRAGTEQLDLEALLHAVVDASPVSIVSLDLDGRVTSWNRTAESMYGWTADEVIGRRLPIIPDDEWAAYREAVLLPISRGEHVAGCDDRRKTKNGELLDVYVTPAPILDAFGRVSGCMAITVDLSARRHAEAAMRSSEERFRAIVEHAPIGITLRDPRKNFLTTNQRYRDMVGYSEEELVRLSFMDYTHPDDRALQAERERELASGEIDSYRLEKRYVHKDGHIVWVRCTVSMVRDGNEQPLFIVASVEDITAQIEAEETLHESRERFKSAFAFAPIGMALVSMDGRWLQVNDALCRIVGRSETELMGLRFQDITHDDDLQIDLANAGRLTAGEVQSYQMEKRYYHGDGHTVWVLLSVSLVRDSSARPLYFVSQIQDITDKKRADESLQTLLAERTEMLEEVEYRALHDTLTDLPNRALLYDRLENAIQIAQRDGVPFALLFLDLDGFKLVNDSLGHHKGDELLILVARRLRKGLRSSDTVARLGGDEFALLLPTANETSAAKVAEAVRGRISTPVTLESTAFEIKASIGVATYPVHGQSAEVLLRRADSAMYVAKRAGGGVVVYGSQDAMRDAVDRLPVPAA